MTHTVIARPPLVARAGLACVAGAAIAVVGELAVALAPQAVGGDRLSHPLTPQGLLGSARTARGSA
jgi:hypothetical protein